VERARENVIMRAWRSAEGIMIVDLGPTAELVVEALLSELPKGIWRERHDYVLLDSDGSLREKLIATVWSIEEELGISVFALIEDDPGVKGFAVASDALCNLRVRTYHRGAYRVEREQETILDGLQEVLARELDGIAVLVERALKDE
jgi:hypothetical protein